MRDLLYVLVAFDFTKPICWMKSSGNCPFHSTLPYWLVFNQFIHLHCLVTFCHVIIPQMIHSPVDGSLGCSWSFCCYKWQCYKNCCTRLLVFKCSPLQWPALSIPAVSASSSARPNHQGLSSTFLYRGGKSSPGRQTCWTGVHPVCLLSLKLSQSASPVTQFLKTAAAYILFSFIAV